MMEFDYVIVGSGAAGCVLANRLSANPNVTVALLEAGSRDRHPFIHMPKGLGKLLNNPSHLWTYRAEPEPGTAMEPEYWLRGRVLGGSTSINGMMYVRGQPADFEALSSLTSEDWNWENISRAYTAIENHELGAAGTRGLGGPLNISMPTCRTPLTEAAIEAGAKLGWPPKNDINAPDGGEGIGYVPRTIFRGRRQSAAVAFLRPVARRRNLRILTGALVDRVVFARRQAIGVEVIRAGRREVIKARREVILAGGAMASSCILERSGVGDPVLLSSLGIDVVHANPSVGENMREQRAVMFQFRLKHAWSQNHAFHGWGAAKAGLQYLLRRSGPMTCGAMEVGAWFRSAPDRDRPDCQILVGPYSFDRSLTKLDVERSEGMSAVVHPLRPSSRGRIHIHSRDPNAMPRLEPRYAASNEDRDSLISGMRMLLRLMDQEPLKDFIAEETWPTLTGTSDEDLLALAERHGGCGYHTVGTCRMGNDAESVVDPELRVRGVAALRVMDTSVMPIIVSGNTNAPTMAMAWRAAEIIQRAHGDGRQHMPQNTP